MTQKTKKLNDPSVPKLTTLADDALVTIVDKTTGATSTIEYGKLRELMFNNMSTRNLIANSSVEKSGITSTVSGSYQFVNKLEEGKKYQLVVCATGTTLTIRPIGISDNNIDFFSPNSRTLSGRKQIIVCPIQSAPAATGVRFWTGDGQSTVHWCTLVEGDIPMTLWQPAPEDILGGG